MDCKARVMHTGMRLASLLLELMDTVIATGMSITQSEQHTGTWKCFWARVYAFLPWDSQTRRHLGALFHAEILCEEIVHCQITAQPAVPPVCRRCVVHFMAMYGLGLA